MSKYSKEFKLKVLKEYKSGKYGGIKIVAAKYNIPKGTLTNWITWFDNNGLDGISKKIKNKIYSDYFKLSVIQYRQINECSYKKAAKHFGITNGSMIANWTKTYEENGFSGFDDKRRRPRKTMSKIVKNKSVKPLNETERDELIRLREENRLLKMKEIYEKKLSALLLKEELEAKKSRSNIKSSLRISCNTSK